MSDAHGAKGREYIPKKESPSSDQRMRSSVVGSFTMLRRGH
jgi:hypothetical protein